jgi:poly-beta-1,6-N-acetyl-D-glucosamine synthase
VTTGRKAIDDGRGRPLDRAEGLYWRYESKLKEWETAVGSVTAVAGEILAFRREAFPVPEKLTLTEDFVQAMLAALDGWRVVYVPTAVSIEPASATVQDEAVRRARLVTGRWQALWMLVPKLLVRRPRFALQVISHKGLRPFVQVMLGAAAVSNVVAARGRRWPKLLGAAQAAFYAAALLGWRNERRGRRNRWLFLPYYFCRMNFAALTGARAFFRDREASYWTKVTRS